VSSLAAGRLGSGRKGRSARFYSGQKKGVRPIESWDCKTDDSKGYEEGGRTGTGFGEIKSNVMRYYLLKTMVPKGGEIRG